MTRVKSSMVHHKNSISNIMILRYILKLYKIFTITKYLNMNSNELPLDIADL